MGGANNIKRGRKMEEEKTGSVTTPPEVPSYFSAVVALMPLTNDGLHYYYSLLRQIQAADKHTTAKIQNVNTNQM